VISGDTASGFPTDTGRKEELAKDYGDCSVPTYYQYQYLVEKGHYYHVVSSFRCSIIKSSYYLPIDRLNKVDALCSI
jgi:hypothetical protein